MRRRFLLLIIILPAFIFVKAADKPQKVHTGVYLMNLYDLNVSEYSYYADFYLWFRWQGELDPMNIEFVNSLEKWGFTQNNFHDTTNVLADNWNYNGMRTEGRFYHPFDLKRFPLDRHDLEMRIENVEFPIDSMVLVPDTTHNLYRKDFLIPGWKIMGAKMITMENRYNTNFGETGSNASNFSDFVFQLTIGRPVSYFLLKLMLPLLIVITASLGALFIYPAYLDARISLPIGGLLSCVFLQQSYSSALPDVGYMVLMDKIYLLSYMLIAMILLRVVIIGNKAAKGEDNNWPLIKRKDKRLGIGLFSCYLTGIFLLTIFG